MKSFTDNEGNHWHAFNGVFWGITFFEKKYHLQACIAENDGTPEMENRMPYACDAQDVSQDEIDFVNKVFGSNFTLNNGALVQADFYGSIPFTL